MQMIGFKTSEETMKHSVLLDTSFFIRLLNPNDSLHENAKGYYKYYLEEEIALKFSTISIAEFCVVGNIDELPLKNLQIVPFNIPQAKRTGEFAKVIFEQKKISGESLSPRAIIPNDSKLFAQADWDKTVTHFVTSDKRSNITLNHLRQVIQPKFAIINIQKPYNEVYGVLDL